MKRSMDRVQRGGPWTGSTGVVHGPGVHVLHTSWISHSWIKLNLIRVVRAAMKSSWNDDIFNPKSLKSMLPTSESD